MLLQLPPPNLRHHTLAIAKLLIPLWRKRNSAETPADPLQLGSLASSTLSLNRAVMCAGWQGLGWGDVGSMGMGKKDLHPFSSSSALHASLTLVTAKPTRATALHNDWQHPLNYTTYSLLCLWDIQMTTIQQVLLWIKWSL